MKSKFKSKVIIAVFSFAVLGGIVYSIFLRQSSETVRGDTYYPYPSVKVVNYSDTRTLNGNVVDFSKCIPDKTAYPRNFGSDNTEILGIRGSKCIVKFGKETENPSYDGRFFEICLVPAKLGTEHGFTGNNKSEIAEHCKKI